jgi:hypothetical protein
MRRTKAKRRGEPHIKSGKPLTANLDAGSTCRLTWASHTTKRLLNTDAFDSVLIRRAIVVYVQHLETLMEKSKPEQLEREAALLSSAARGTTEELPEEDLIAVPLRAFSAIDRDARTARAERDREEIQEMLKQPVRHPYE